jgi:hypothetical protein
MHLIFMQTSLQMSVFVVPNIYNTRDAVMNSVISGRGLVSCDAL